MEYIHNLGVFSPDGRLYQVEYAQHASNQGSTVCISTIEGKDIEIFYENRSPNKLHIPNQRIYKIYSNVYAIFSGVQPDSLVLADYASQRAANFVLETSVEPTVNDVAEFIKQKMQRTSVSVSLRPFGVKCAVFGIDKKGNEPRIFVIEADGSKVEFTKCAIGMKSDKAYEVLKVKNGEFSTLDALLAAVSKDSTKISGFKLTSESLTEIENSVISSYINK